MTLKKPAKSKRISHKGSHTDAPDAPDFTVAENELAAHAAATPASSDFPVEESEMTDAEILRRFRTSLSNTVLPGAPNIPGFHVCWVPITSNNQSDTVDFRKQLGYVVVKEEEVPSYISPSNRAAQFAGCISHNELILMKLPLRLYQLYMKDSHHSQPNEQERAIRADIDAKLVDEEGASVKRDENEMTGMRRLARKVKEPTFT